MSTRSVSSVEDHTIQQNQEPLSAANEYILQHDSEKIKDPLLLNCKNDEKDCDKRGKGKSPQKPREVKDKWETGAEPVDTNRSWPDWGEPLPPEDLHCDTGLVDQADEVKGAHILKKMISDSDVVTFGEPSSLKEREKGKFPYKGSSDDESGQGIDRVTSIGYGNSDHISSLPVSSPEDKESSDFENVSAANSLFNLATASYSGDCGDKDFENLDDDIDLEGKESTNFDVDEDSAAEILMNMENISKAHLPDDAKITKEAQKMLSQIAGKPFYEKMETSRSAILPQLLPSLKTILHELNDEGLEITSEVIRKEASKCVYIFLKAQNQKVSAHPEHIKEIPRKWLLEHGNLYPSDEQYGEIAEETGLEKKQVATLFQNLRKRIYKNDPEFNANLKSRFSVEVTHKLREWQRGNPGKQPDKETVKSLTRENNMTKKQIVDWFNNHKEERNRSKKRTGTSSGLLLLQASNM